MSPVEQCEAAFICVASKHDMGTKRGDYIFCERCKKWAHIMCEALSDVDTENMSNSDESYTCLKCQGLNSYDVAKKHGIDYAQKLNTILTNLQLVSGKCEQIRQKIANTMGPREKQIECILNEIGVKRQAYHGDVFVGNHCKVILSKQKDSNLYNYEKLCNVLSDCKKRAHLIEIFSVYSRARELMSRRSFLNDTDINELVSLCTKFGEIYPVYFESFTITLKMHEFIFDVPRFVKTYKTIGLFSEEEGESVHRFMNEHQRSLHGVRDTAKMLTLALKHFEIRGSCNSSLVLPEKRLCQKCNKDRTKSEDKVFLKNGVCLNCLT